MMISQIDLLNFKAFQSLELPMAAVTVLAGTNSSGKSTVLQAIGLMRQSLAMPADVPGLSLNGNYVQLGIGRDLRHERWNESEQFGSDIGVRIHTDAEVGTFRASYVADSETLPLSSNMSNDEIERLLGGKEFQYIRASRMSPATSYQRSHLAVVEQNTLGAEGQYAVDFLRTLGDEFRVSSSLALKSEESNSLLDQTEAWLGLIAPGVNLNTEAFEGTDSVRLSFQIGRTGLDSSNSYRPTNVGFGLAYSLPIIVACLISKPGGLLLLENPEAHLHPAGQAAMGRLIVACANAGTQVIVETHSDHVLNSIRIAVKRADIAADKVALNYFSRSTRGEPDVKNLSIAADGTLPEWPIGFFDEWDNALIELNSD